MSSVITISQPPSVPGDKSINEARTEMTFAPMEFADCEGEELEIGVHSDSAQATSDNEDELGKKWTGLSPIEESLMKLESGRSKSRDDAKDEDKHSVKKAQATITRRRKENGPDAVIVLKEERVRPHMGLLHSCRSFLAGQHLPRFPQIRIPTVSLRALQRRAFTYRHSLECTITWNNVEGLMNISHKLSVSSLQRECLTFLLTHAAGKPIKAMRIAELFEEEELYRESSRFVLDNPGGWTEQELSTLSQETLLKLEKRFAAAIDLPQGTVLNHCFFHDQSKLVPGASSQTWPHTSRERIPMCTHSKFFCLQYHVQNLTCIVFFSAQHVPTPKPALVSSKRNGDTLTTPSSDSVSL
jgi:hypothetical protein